MKKHNLNEQVSRMRNMMELGEVDYNYHAGDLSSGDYNQGDLGSGTLKPHGSDSIFRMEGRGTGHFGSGIYFSSYNLRDKTNYDDNYGEYSDYRNRNPNLIQVSNSVYRVDMDLYKNLYRVQSNDHGRWLFNTLKDLNSIFYIFVRGFDDLSNLSKRYLVVLNNMGHLGLKLPNYKGFIKLLNQAKEDYESRFDRSKEARSNASFSTRIMEWNGYNGVNVSGVWEWDNTLHGSVIYDINKVSGDMEPVKVDTVWNKINTQNVIGSFMDVKTKLLSNEKIVGDSDYEKLNSMPLNQSLALIKRYNNWFMEFDLLRDELKKAYIQSLHKKLLNDEDMVRDMKEWDIRWLIDNNLMNIIYDPKIIKGGGTLLNYIFNSGYRIGDDRVKKVINGINRELNDDEKESLDYLNEYL
jgi:hypothetical protein